MFDISWMPFAMTSQSVCLCNSAGVMKLVLRKMLRFGIFILPLSVAQATIGFPLLNIGVNARQKIPCSKLVDLTHPFDQNTLGYPGIKKFTLTLLQNKTTDEGYWLQIENYSSGIHTGTHMDAPCHIKKGQWCLDQIPVERFMACAAVVSITHRSNSNPDANLEVQDLKEWENANGRTLDGPIIILVDSGWGKKWLDPEAFIGTTTDDLSKVHFPGISPEAARWLRDNRNIYGVGIDTVSLDNGQAVKREAHEALFEANFYGLEGVANIDQLPSWGAYCYVFPMKISNASGAPTRIICELSSDAC